MVALGTAGETACPTLLDQSFGEVGGAGGFACRWKLISIANPNPENGYAPQHGQLYAKHTENAQKDLKARGSVGGRIRPRSQPLRLFDIGYHAVEDRMHIHKFSGRDFRGIQCFDFARSTWYGS